MGGGGGEGGSALKDIMSGTVAGFAQVAVGEYELAFIGIGRQAFHSLSPSFSPSLSSPLFMCCGTSMKTS